MVIAAWWERAAARPGLISFASRIGASRASQQRAKQTTASAAPPPVATAMKTDKQQLFQEVKQLVPKLTAEMHKGSAGKVAVIGGCREYTGAPFFSSLSALKMGADLAHVFCTQGAATVIKSYSPELIVHPYLPDTSDEPNPEEAREMAAAYFAEGSKVSSERQQHLRERAVAAIEQWLDRFDAVVVGPGLGRDPLILSTIADVMRSVRQRNLPMVVDADGLWLVNQDPGLVQGYNNAVLTPNKVEFQRLAQKLGVDQGASSALQDVAAALQGPVIVRKGSADVICDGSLVLECTEQGSLRRAGGQGDVLSGCIAVFSAWAQRNKGVPTEQLHAGQSGGNGSSSSAAEGSSVPPLMVAAYGGAFVTRAAARRAFERKRRSMGAADLITELGPVVDDLFDSDP